MRRARPTAVRAARAVALAAATAALALALRQTTAALVPLAFFALAAAAAPFLEWATVPAFLAQRLPRIHVRLLLLSALVAWPSRSMGMLVLDPALVPLVTSVACSSSGIGSASPLTVCLLLDWRWVERALAAFDSETRFSV